MRFGERIVVTGVGIVSPLGVGVRTVWPRLLAGGCGVKRLESLRGQTSEVAAPVPRGSEDGEFDPARCRLMAPGDAQTIAPFAQFALAAAAEALDSARWAPATDAERERTGVAIGSGIGSLADIVDASDTMRERGPRRVSAYFVPRMLVNMAAGHVSIRAGLRGPLSCPATACATGASAVSDAALLLMSGAADVMLAGGAEACIEPLAIAGFGKLRAVSTAYNASPERASRPFDAGRDGFVMGEGAAVLVLETEGHARRRGATVLAELCGFGLSADAHHITAPPDNGAGALRTMRTALRMAEACGHPFVDYVNAHATSTPQGDAAELRAISALAADRPAGSLPLLVSATKGATGHLLGGAGALEAAFTVLALHHQVLPPTINLEKPEPADLPGIAHVTVGGAPADGRPLRAALSNSFGFGGVNVSLCFARWAPAGAPVTQDE
ncbi:3-oxoacyl [Chrysochromulina tobinii]|uniref:3-oxoacyl-[acyl-carrier-protein] synthase n=1 Tax=Chrysochromulina tobinii TaxID=1460289 RepID=A0A0M0J3T9_9EUKA|nr:3-oxoacyl [Chrysochromulina tobinii]|eukprot:KOO20908.1 3-oxoacyl [Chrysochromulina sp. CCMP291]